MTMGTGLKKAGEETSTGRGLKESQKTLERQEEIQEVGLASRQSKGRLLDFSKLSTIFPGWKFRACHPDKVESREAEGWVRATEAETAHLKRKPTIGTQYVVMKTSTRYVEARAKAVDQRTRSRLEATRGQFKADVAVEERELRSQGALAPDKSLLSDEP